MKKLSIVTLITMLGLSLSVSAGRYDNQSNRHNNQDTRSAVKGLHDRSPQPSRYQSKQQPSTYSSNKNRSHNRSHGQIRGQGGFNHDYRGNRHFDDSYVVTKPNYSQGSYRNKYRNYSYGDWRNDSRHYHSQWRTYGHTYYYYQPYNHDRYRYRPVRGLGHYYQRVGYGYGHWHEGHWCDVYHAPNFYVSYYNHYPYHNGWRMGDGDFGIWFSF
ncbi:hypothetical protein [Marinicella gelatinilytica]|uniref:hypothetical protein n=1 Tax=Marinicella gelatinilytica TaxID=2996017 RepID=UPI002260CDDD|nr:hypothetical protein [Marinicella gelatinilytica]MCX7545917.1 hypothetical protein [Marinicella gelatinilytica]